MSCLKINAKSPPQVAAEATHTSFPVRQIMQPYDGFFKHDLTNFRHAWHIPGLGYSYYSVVGICYPYLYTLSMLTIMPIGIQLYIAIRKN